MLRKMSYIDEICREICPNSKPLKSISSLTLRNGEPLINLFRKISKLLENKLFLNDLEEHLGKQLDFLGGILGQCEVRFPEIAPFIAECYHSIYSNCFHKFDAISDWCRDKNISHESLDSIFIHMIEESGNLSPVDTWNELICGDMIPSLDASLVYKLWEELHDDNPADFIVVVAETEHINNLSSLSNELFNPRRTPFISLEKSSSIYPEQLENLLFESLPKNNKEICCLQ